LSAVSPSVFSWSMLGRRSSAAFLLPRPEKGVWWPTPCRTHPVAAVALKLTDLVSISRNAATGRATWMHLSSSSCPSKSILICNVVCLRKVTLSNQSVNVSNWKSISRNCTHLLSWNLIQIKFYLPQESCTHRKTTQKLHGVTTWGVSRYLRADNPASLSIERKFKFEMNELINWD